MNKKLVAKQAVVINAPSHKVWDALANPEIARQYMFGTNAIPNWKKVGTMVSDQNSQSTAYKDKGVLLKMEPEHLIKYCYYSPLSGLPDKPENYHTVTLELSDAEARTILLLSQDNNPSEQARIHTKNSWGMMLTNLKELLETQSK